ncbi:unnamed protein product [Didymodactylos carnosus]|nr:unnamed protein product [Didymodactylos carnosus]CAF3666068.1 unnamed protein product [Didymodactylos carnosus]
MMSNSYQYIANQTETEWKFARAKLWTSYFEDGGTLPPPFNIVPSPKSLYYVMRYLYRRVCGCSKREWRNRWQSINKVMSKMKERDLKYDTVIRELVKRYIMKRQQKDQTEGVTEDDLNEIKQDISAFRFELLEILTTNGYNVQSLRKNPACRVGRKRGKINLEKTINKNLFDMSVIPERAEQQQQQASSPSNTLTNPKQKLTAQFKRAITMMKQRSEPNEPPLTDSANNSNAANSNTSLTNYLFGTKPSQSLDSAILDKLACLAEEKLIVLPHDKSTSTNITTVNTSSTIATVKLLSTPPHRSMNDNHQSSSPPTPSTSNAKIRTSNTTAVNNNRHHSPTVVTQESSDSHVSLSIINPSRTSSIQHLSTTTNQPILHYEQTTTTTVLNMDPSSSSSSGHSSNHTCPSRHLSQDTVSSSFTPINAPHPTTTLSSQPLVKQSLQQIHSSIMQTMQQQLSPPSPQQHQQQSASSPSNQLSAGYIRLLNGGRAPIASPDPLSLTDDSVCANTPEVDIL